MHVQHLSDRDLVLAIDGELPVRRQADVDAHLIDCAACRRRCAELRESGELAAVLSRRDRVDADKTGAAREALRLKLASLSRQQDDRRAERVAAAMTRPARWAIAVLATAAALLVVLRLGGVPPGRLDAPAAAAIESGALPVASLTPGATWNVSVQEVCAPEGREQALVPEAVRHEVVSRYGMAGVPADEYELDYLITPQLGGAPTVQNLWPQRYASRTWNAHVKDQLEDLLPKLVCEGTVPLQAAQRDIAADWIAAYKKYFRTDTPLPRPARTAALRLVSLPLER